MTCRHWIYARQWAPLTGVTIVTARCDDGQPYGLTVNSFNSVSLDPPLVLWSLDNHHDKGDLFRNAGGFAVNIMPAGSDELIRKFAVNTADRFDGTAWHWGASGHPVLDSTDKPGMPSVGRISRR